MTSPNTFRIRPAGFCANFSPADAPFITTAFDSNLPHLSATGNAGQWGIQPFSQKEGFLQSVYDDIDTSEEYRQTGTGEKLRMFIAEVDDEKSSCGDGLFRSVNEHGKPMLSVAAVTIRIDDFAAHLKGLPELQHVIKREEERGKFIFIDVLISDYRTGPKRKGSGLALLNFVKDLASREGKSTIFLDCYMGGTGRLIEYYEQQGFHRVAGFEYKQANGNEWPGRLLRLDLEQTDGS